MSSHPSKHLPHTQRPAQKRRQTHLRDDVRPQRALAPAVALRISRRGKQLERPERVEDRIREAERRERPPALEQWPPRAELGNL